MKPLVSVLITAYNRQDYIADSITSVLNSTYDNLEVIIVDDCSTDKTFDIICEFANKDSRVRGYRNNENIGQFPNRNYIASLAKGEYLKYLDSDDVIYPYGIDMMMYHALRNPDSGLFISSAQLHDDIPYPIKLTPHEVYHRFYLSGGFPSVGPTALLVKKSVFDRIGGFTIPAYVGTDTEFILKMAKNGPIVITEPGVIWYREHDGQEMVKGIKTNEYEINDYTVFSKLLEDDDCPLTAAERQAALKRLRKRNARFVLRYLVRREPKASFLIYRQLKPSVGELFSAVFK